MIALRNWLLLALSLLLSFAACRREEPPDAYGNIEAVEVVVAPETSGRIESFRPREGERLAAGALVGTIDTAVLALESRQIEAQRQATAARLAEIAHQADALAVERRIAERAYERTRRLFEQRAATAESLDRTERDLRVLEERIEAARAQAETVRREVESFEAQLAQVAERIGQGRIVNPIDGTVLTTYANAGEVAQTGQPLYRIADLRTVDVRAYVDGTQLASLRLGQRVRVTVDAGEGERRTVPGTVGWIASDAEFTPTPIQTREERAALVYAIKIRVANPDGVLKIGMPADVDW